MRRVELNETFHGTAAGQVPNSKDLEERFGLTERQAQCAALLRIGTPTPAISEVLGIAASTLETHLSDLRQGFSCDSTEQLRSTLVELISDQELAAFHCWPAGTNASLPTAPHDVELAVRLRTCVSVEQALYALKDSLVDFGVQHIYYCFIPHSVQGLLRGDLIDRFLAPEAVQRAFFDCGGLLAHPMTQTVFEAPTDVPVIALDPEVSPPDLGRFNGICRDHGASHILGMGFPSGPSFVGLACTLHIPNAEVLRKVHDQSESIRASAMATHAALLTTGALAAKLRLTIRERNALSSVALGKRNTEVARELGVSERGLSKLLASARTKLHARTNTEAAVKASLVNALVFL